MSHQAPKDPNPNTPQNWDERWKNIGLAQKDDAWVNLRLDKVAEFIAPGNSVIDLAAGAGLIRHKLPENCLYLPVDFSERAIELCQVPGILATCTSVPVDDHSYHTVLAMEILEHLDSPPQLILEASRIAQHQVIVTVPDNRLPPEEFKYHRRTWNEPLLTDFLRDFAQFAYVQIFHTAANLVAQCLKTLTERLP